jgi:hypothetical protein
MSSESSILEMFLGMSPYWLGAFACLAARRFLNRLWPEARLSQNRREELYSQVKQRDFTAVEQHTGYPVPQVLRDFYTPRILRIEQFETPDVTYSSGPEQPFFVIQEFLPLTPKTMDYLALPDSTWLPFAQDGRGYVYFLPLAEHQGGDGPIYRIDLEMGRWGRARGNDIRRVSDSLRQFLALGQSYADVKLRGGTHPVYYRVYR